ncbi:MAG TPA: ABC transporter permease [Gaiellales bacterium]|jgi:peptide/nickel transport system permease protein|nr:ABC transporter permease [Gaiellales bacterium]
MSAVPAEAPAAGGAVDAGKGQVRRELLRELTRSKTFLIGAVIVAFWCFCAIFGYHIGRYGPYNQDLNAVNAAPSSAHWFGTDQLGRDIFSRVIAGARTVIVVSLLATALGTVLGTFLGLVTGYLRGWVDETISRFIDAVLALPLVVTAIMVIAALGPSDATLTITIGLIFAPLIARTVRTAVIQERELDYVTAARLRGESGVYIMSVELLPNVLAPVMVEFTVRLGYAIFTAATLSFLNFGIQLPTPDWGLDISQNFSVITAGYWWEVLFAAAAIATLVIGINLVADAVERVLDR